jgi:cellulose synthase/poly-beta-1,6-N-acetylglucosamine synthase-like glycosyltransferase
MAVTPSLRVYKPKSILQRVQMIEYLIGIFLRKIFSFLGSLHVTPGPFTIYRKELFDRYGGYEENNMTEDIEVALRIQSLGYEIENSIDANVYTVSPYHFRPLLKQRLRWYLGFIENVYNYRHLFAPKYGNLGLLVLPAAFISIFLVIIMMFYSLFISADELVRRLINYYNIGFDVTKLFDFKIDLFYINIESYTALTFVTLILGIVLVLLAKRLSDEKEKIRFHYLFYALIYWFLFGFWWLGAFFMKFTGKRVYWGQKRL